MAIILQADLENLLQIDVGAEPDSTVAWYIAAAQAAAEQYCHRHFDYNAGEVETLDGDGQATIIQVDRWPIISVASIVESGVTLTAGTDYLGYFASGTIRRTSGGRIKRAWRNDLQGIVVTYDGGYQEEQAGDGATAPSDLILAITRIAGRLFKSGAQPVGGVPSSVTLEGIGSIGYAASKVTAPVLITDLVLVADEKAGLDPYMNPGIV
jgi:hypothetical protein